MNEEEVKKQLDFDRFLLTKFTSTLRAVNDPNLSQSVIDDIINRFVNLLGGTKIYQYPWTSPPVLYLVQCYLDRFEVFEF